MRILYAPEPFWNESDRKVPSIFLAGPTPREAGVPSWRPVALDFLKAKKWEGIVMVPETRDGRWQHSYDDQIEWECIMRDAARVILFWVPRDMSPGPSGRAKMPALTTNVEFGLDIPTGKVIYGRPDHAPSCKYLDYHYHKFTGQRPFSEIEPMLIRAMEISSTA